MSPTKTDEQPGQKRKVLSGGIKDGEKNAFDEMTFDRKDDASDANANGKREEEDGKNDTEPESKKRKVTSEASGEKDGGKNAFDEVKADEQDVKNAASEEQDQMTEGLKGENGSVVQDKEREAAIPSSILEKGIIYFFFRGRVGITEPKGIEDIARSYIVLRPLPIGSKIGSGPLQDDGKARLLALPKKKLPKTQQDRFLVFVEKAAVSIADLREQFSSNEYATKTSGTSNTPAATPFAEGVYALTSTGRESHLAYQITFPEIGEIQKELGLHEKGSFVCSVKNPEAPGPANATIDNPAKYSEELQGKFRGLRWTPLEAEHLEYEGTQMLLIGEGMGDFGRSLEVQGEDKKDEEKEKPEEEIEKLGEEDHDRVDGLKEDDPVFADLGLSSKEYPHMQTTW